MTNKDQSTNRVYYNGATTNQGVSTAFMTATIMGSDGEMFEIGNLGMVSISSTRPTFPVTNLQYVAPRGYTAGHRLWAGSLVFTVFERSAFTNITNKYTGSQYYTNKSDTIKGRSNSRTAFWDMQADTLPPFDIHIFYPMEDGSAAYEMIAGVKIVDFGSIRSIQNIEISESYSYMALDWTPIQKLSEIPSGNNTPGSNMLYAAG